MHDLAYSNYACDHELPDDVLYKANKQIIAELSKEYHIHLYSIKRE